MSVNFICADCGDPVHAEGINEPPDHRRCLLCWVVSLTADEKAIARLRAKHAEIRAWKRVGGGELDHWTSGKEHY